MKNELFVRQLKLAAEKVAREAESMVGTEENLRNVTVTISIEPGSSIPEIEVVKNLGVGVPDRTYMTKCLNAPCIDPNELMNSLKEDAIDEINNKFLRNDVKRG